MTSSYDCLIPVRTALPWVLAASVFGLGCSSDTERSRAEPSVVTVYAAASLTEAVTRVGAAFEEETGIHVISTCAATSTLARQIAAGAPADVFISAHPRWIDFLAAKGRVRGKPIEYLTNSLVVVSPSKGGAPLSSLSDLTDPEFERISLADSIGVPAGMYAKEALLRAQVWESLQGRIVSAVDVRAALAYVERHEVDAGIVYRTDVQAGDGAGKFEVIYEISAELSSPIKYSAVMTSRAENIDAALRFLEFMRGPKAEKIFLDLGFGFVKQGSGQPETRNNQE